LTFNFHPLKQFHRNAFSPVEKIFFTVYGSSAVEEFTAEELRRLLHQTRQNNANYGITGMLLYKDGNILQVLEGAEPQVKALYSKICQDPRHFDHTVLLEGYTEERQFPDWSMGFRDLNSPEVQQTPGYSEFLNTPLTGAEFADHPTRCQRLLLTFKKNMR